MFCSNCGKEAIGKFCSNCGAPIITGSNNGSGMNFQHQSQNVKPEMMDNFIVVNNIELNLSEIVRLYGKNKIDAIKFVKSKADTSLNDAKSIVDKAYEFEQMRQEPKKGFWEKIKEDNANQVIRQHEKIKEDIQKQEQLEKDGVAYCPECHSTSLSANKKGFGIFAKKVRVTCLKCGHQFWPGGK